MEKKPDPKKVPNHLQIPNFISETLLNHFWTIFGAGFFVHFGSFAPVESAPRGWEGGGGIAPRGYAPGHIRIFEIWNVAAKEYS